MYIERSSVMCQVPGGGPPEPPLEWMEAFVLGGKPINRAIGPASKSQMAKPRPKACAARPTPNGISLPNNPATLSSASTEPLRPGRDEKRLALRIAYHPLLNNPSRPRK